MPKPPPGCVFVKDTEAGPGIASRLGIEPSTYRKWRMRGEGPKTFFLGKRVVARIEAVEAYITAQEQAALQVKNESRPPEPKFAAA